MITDIDQAPADEWQCEVCVIGAGAAGITVAREFFDLDVRVIVLEGGGRTIEPLSQGPYRSYITGLPHDGIHGGRFRALGGSTTRWAGQALPLMEIDFVERPWVPCSGWPITRGDLDSFYARAEKVMQIPHATYDRRSWPRAEMPLESPTGTIDCAYSQFAVIPDFAKKYAGELAASSNVMVLTHANVVVLHTQPTADTVRSATVRSFRGKTGTVSARFFVLCCGGIDTARLLLVSSDVEPNGIGNRHGNVGRFFQDHPTLTVPFRPRDPDAFTATYGAVRRRGSLNLIKFFPSAEFQSANRILNVGAEVIEECDDDAIAAARRISRRLCGSKAEGSYGRDVLAVLSRPTLVTTAAVRKLLGRRPCKSARHALLVSAEQEPSPDSRVTLSDDVDELGMRRVQLDWRLTELLSQSVLCFLSELSEQWRQLGLADINVSAANVLGRETGAKGGYGDLYHHIGTTRMGSDPTTSVVDTNCRVHGYENLYVGSSAVFPTGGFSNPTLTVIALCCRLSDEIKNRMMTCINTGL